MPLRALTGLFITALILWTPFVSAQAAESLCTCFCATEEGTLKPSRDQVTEEKCTQLCQENPVAVCASTPRQFPDNNGLCFTADACQKQNGVFSTTQPRECPTGWHYCFPSPEKSKVKLNIQIGDMTTVGDLGTYIQKLYQWMLGAGALIAIVMVMIGGFQYALGAAASGQLAQAKDRIKNGLIGLVLLVSVVVIVQMINPQLLKLDLPRPSLLRPVDLTQKTCATFKQEGYGLKILEGDGKSCGSFAEVVEAPPGVPLPDGLTCYFMECARGGCVISPEQKGQCVECQTISNDNPESSARPSRDLCGSLTFEKRSGLQLQTEHRCVFHEKGFDTPESAISNLDEDACYEIAIDCKEINECDDYEAISVFYRDDGNEQKEFSLWRADPVQLTGICSVNPCKWKINMECEPDGPYDCDRK
ncbi:hypothetical protein FJZ23_01440 [Candidatus Parcubacteria bacterium]|nr:hypothetical protein [Candidatus Parcubacteria bacterium]